MDTILVLVGVGVAGTFAYGLFRLCVGSPEETVNPEVARKIDNALGMTDEGFRKSQAFHNARMADPDVEYGMVIDPRDFQNLFTKKSSA